MRSIFLFHLREEHNSSNTRHLFTSCLWKCFFSAQPADVLHHKHPNLSTLNVPDEGYFNPETWRQDNVPQIKIHVIPLVMYQLIIFTDAIQEHGK